MKMKHIKTEPAPVSGQHTPTPWRVIDGIGCGSIYSIQAVNPPSGNGVLAAILHAPDKQRPLMVAQANAEFIVRACNCHDELVKACQALLDHIDSGRSKIRWTSKDTICPGEVGNLDALRAALEKASR